MILDYSIFDLLKGSDLQVWRLHIWRHEINKYIYIYIHAYIHTYIHTYIPGTTWGVSA